MDLGECIKVHDLALRADYEIASKEQEYFFELDVSCACIHTLINILLCMDVQILITTLCDSDVLNYSIHTYP